jgi:hypothetical protein
MRASPCRVPRERGAAGQQRRAARARKGRTTAGRVGGAYPPSIALSRLCVSSMICWPGQKSVGCESTATEARLPTAGVRSNSGLREAVHALMSEAFDGIEEAAVEGAVLSGVLRLVVKGAGDGGGGAAARESGRNAGTVRFRTETELKS